jgi:16S rRNA (uracil1498-N3)-methyltransferase
MSRCVVTDNGKYDKKVKRYNTIAQEAAKQCKRGTIPEVLSAVDFNGMLKSLDGFDKVIFPYENEEKDTLKKVLKSFEGEDIRNIAVVIGPEGGFSDSEAQRLCESGALSASLGKTILRTETAGIVAVAMIMYEMEL